MDHTRPNQPRAGRRMAEARSVYSPRVVGIPRLYGRPDRGGVYVLIRRRRVPTNLALVPIPLACCSRGGSRAPDVLTLAPTRRSNYLFPTALPEVRISFDARRSRPSNLLTPTSLRRSIFVTPLQ